MRYTVRPISDRTWLRPDHTRQRSQFTATWTDTLELLGREVRQIGGTNVVIECDVEERHIRNDGMLRANAIAATPAVVVAMESRFGDLLYRSDRLGSLPWSRKGAEKVWQHNVRAIALTLEALRAVSRYGATETGQQYQGFKALPAGRAMPASHMTADEAWSILGSFSDVPIAKVREEAAADPAVLVYLRKQARAFAHPDRHGGDRTLWDQVEQAAAVLGGGR